MNIKDLQSFVDLSPTSYQVVEHIQMAAAGFVRLDREDAWDLKEGGKYYVVNEDGAILLFSMGKRDPETMAFRTVISHTDSPALRLLPGGVRGERTVYEWMWNPTAPSLMPTGSIDPCLWRAVSSWIRRPASRVFP